MSDQYWEILHVVANQALHNVLPKKEDILVNAEPDDTVEVEMLLNDILKAFSMFHDRGMVSFFY